MIEKITQNHKGTTLLEIVVGIAIIGIVAMSLYMALFNVTKLMSDSKQKIGAVALANEQMEIIRNLEYESIGTIGWIPAGPIEQTQTIERNNFTYTIDTSIKYIDDAFDGIGASDLIETDYKQAQVTVSWTMGLKTKNIIFVSKFVPEGLESNIGGGTLSVNIIDATVQPISDATVKIDSVTETEPIHGVVTTGADGNVRIPGLPAQEYQIRVLKNDYASVQTYPAKPSSLFNPVDSNLLVTEGDVVMKTLTINKSADFLLKATNIADDNGIDGVDVELKGGPVIGTDPETLTWEGLESTDSSGEIKLENIDPGDYDIVNIETIGTSEYEYVGTDTDIPIHLVSEDDKEVNLIFAKKDIDSLLVVVSDSVSEESIEGAEVEVSSASGFSQTTTTSGDGRAYFPIAEDPEVLMTDEIYNIKVKADNFMDISTSKDVNNFTEIDILMTPQ